MNHKIIFIVISHNFQDIGQIALPSYFFSIASHSWCVHINFKTALLTNITYIDNKNINHIKNTIACSIPKALTSSIVTH